METLILTMDTIALMVVLYFSFRGEKDPANLEQGPFRIRTYTKPKPQTKTKTDMRRR